MSTEKSVSPSEVPEQLPIKIADIAKEAEALARQSQEVAIIVDRLLKRIIGKISPIDFEARAAAAGWKGPLKINFFIVSCIDEIKSISDNIKIPICEIGDKFYVFEGRYWRKVDDKDFRQFLSQCAESLGMNEFLARYVDFRKKLAEQAGESFHKTQAEKSSTEIKLNLQNGTLVVSNGKVNLKNHNPEDLLLYVLPFSYDEKAGCPKFQSFLDKVLPEKELQLIIAEYLGYVFIPVSLLKLEKVLFLHGSGSNGKSVLLEVITALLGGENISQYTLEQLTHESGYYIPGIADKLMNWAGEVSAKMGSASSFKSLSSGEPLVGREIRKGPITISNYAKLAFNINVLPKDVEQTHAYFRRYLIVPFNVTISEEEKNVKLSSQIIEDELPGILNWVLKGLERLLTQEKFTDSKIVERELEQYRLESDSVLLYLKEKNYKKSSTNKTSLQQLYSDYHLFCQVSGMVPVRNSNFSKRLRSNGYEVKRGNLGVMVFIELKSDEEIKSELGDDETYD
jgi:putative DNA primase/helicase